MFSRTPRNDPWFISKLHRFVITIRQPIPISVQLIRACFKAEFYVTRLSIWIEANVKPSTAVDIGIIVLSTGLVEFFIICELLSNMEWRCSWLALLLHLSGLNHGLLLLILLLLFYELNNTCLLFSLFFWTLALLFITFIYFLIDFLKVNLCLIMIFAYIFLKFLDHFLLLGTS